MFSYQTIVAFLVFVAGLLFGVTNLKRWLRYGHKALFAYVTNKCVNITVEELRSRKEKIFENLDDLACDNRPLKVLEIGAGAGANFKYLPKHTEIICLEPNESSRFYLLKRATNEFPELKVEFRVGVAEDMSSVASESIDVVISTHVLCSVADVDQSLKEILRILKKGGKFIFLEHILAEDGSRVQYWQYFLNAVWKFLMMGCMLTRCTNISILKAGFSATDIDIFECNMKTMKFVAPLVRRHCTGVAVK